MSVISDYYTDPNRWQFNPVETMDSKTVRMLKEVMDKLDVIDKRLKDVECNDPKKAQFKKSVAKRIRETRARA